jgi:hypothetical protein
MKRYRQKGFDLSPRDLEHCDLQGPLGLYTSREQNGLWSAWVENDAPPSPCDQTLKLFVGSSAFQAQIKAIRWMRGEQEGCPADQGAAIEPHPEAAD